MYEIRFYCLHSLKGGGATDVTPAEEQVKWIAVGAVVLAVLVAILTTVCVCEIVCGKRQRKYVFDRGMHLKGRRKEGSLHSDKASTCVCMGI